MNTHDVELPEDVLASSGSRSAPAPSAAIAAGKTARAVVA